MFGVRSACRGNADPSVPLLSPEIPTPRFATLTMHAYDKIIYLGRARRM